jgi:hypothetical protein
MKLTPLGKAVIAVGLILLACKILLLYLGDGGLGHAIAASRITPVDVMVFLALGFVVLLVVLNRNPPQRPNINASTRSAPSS